MFEKAAVFTDIHVGRDGDSARHNACCLEYARWFLDIARVERCDTILFLGDFFHDEDSLGLLTISVGLQIVQMLAKEFPVYIIVGNHDCFYQHNRSIISTRLFETIPNVILINETYVDSNVALVPYPVGSEFATIPTIRAKYVFGHFDLPLFLMNEMIESKDRGGLHMDHFEHCEWVFSGHFHKRQLKLNRHGIPVQFIGNTFAMNFNDVNDRQRGCMILEWDKEPRFHDWLDGPNYHRISATNLLTMVESGAISKTFNARSVVECLDDLNIPLEEQFELKAALETMLGSIKFIDQSSEEAQPELILENSIQTPQTLVPELLRKIDTAGSQIDPERLVKLFQGTRGNTE